MVHVTHDRDDRRPRTSCSRVSRNFLGLDLGGVLVFADRLEAEGRTPISSIWSKSSRWFTVTIRPSSPTNWTIWVAGTFMAPASSETEMNSLTRIGSSPAPLLRGTACLHLAERRLVAPAALRPRDPSCPARSSGCSPAPHLDPPTSACPSCLSSGRRPFRRRARGAGGGAAPPRSAGGCRRATAEPAGPARSSR